MHEHDGPQIRPLYQCPACRDAARAPAFASQAFWTCVALGNQILGAGNEIVNRILLIEHLTGFMPGIAIFTTTTYMGDSKYPAAFIPCHQNWEKEGLGGDPV